MSVDRPLTDFAGLLAGHLAELHKRLRRRFGAGAAAARAHPDLPRLEVGARLLTLPDPARGEAHDGLWRLGRGLGELTGLLSRVPQEQLADLDAPLAALADQLEAALTRLDPGETRRTAAADRGWEDVLAGLLNAGSPLATLDDFDEGLRRWDAGGATPRDGRSDWSDAARRWRQVRAHADRLFADGAVPAGLAPADPARAAATRDLASPDTALLLVAGSFRREQVRQRLAAAGCRVGLAAHVPQAVAALTGLQPPALMICDDLAPTHHLTRLHDALGDRPAGALPPVVLVAAGALADRVGARAGTLGAAGVWPEPFALRDLEAVLERARC